MEDLGNININIRELGGGGGRASGGIGGGPGGGAFETSTSAVLFGPLTRMQSKFADMVGLYAGVISNSVRVWQDVERTIKSGIIALSQDRTKAAGFASSLKAELTGFLRSPSLGGYADITREGTATSTTLKALGKTGATLQKAMFGLAVVGSVASVAVAGLRKASEHASKRIEEVGKFSGQILGAQMEQRVQALRDQLQEAAENGQAYARSIRYQTLENRAYAYMNRQLGFVTAGLASAFSALKTAVFAVIGGFTNLLTFGPRLLDENRQRIVEFFKRFALTGQQRATLTVLEMMLVKLGIIGDNTKKDNKIDPKDINAWFQSDILAMTGKTY